jgi:phosphomannomutase
LGKGFKQGVSPKIWACFCLALEKADTKKAQLVIGQDTRSSSKEIAEIFRSAFLSQARKIIDVGIAPIPAVELAVRSYGADGGVMITASHCPEEFNGWKLLDKTGAILSPDFLDKIIRLKNKIAAPKCSQQRGLIVSKHHDLKKRYIAFAKKIIGEKYLVKIKQRHFKLVVDPNGGAVVPLIKQFSGVLGVEAYYLNMELGRFNRKIEPDFESLNYLREIIKEKGADFAVGFDCDGDRAEVILGEDCPYSEKHGPIVNNQYIFAVLTEEVLSNLKNPQGRIIVTNDCTSYLIKQIAQKYKARVKEVEMGEVKAVNGMFKENSPIAGEGNSGVIFPPSRCRDGILSLAMLLRHLACQQKTLPEVLSEYPDSFSVRDKFAFPPEKHIQIRENIKKILQKQGIKIQERGGKTGTVKALIDDESFIFFRASKTEPGTFRVIGDAPNKNQAKDLLQKGIKIFNDAKAKALVSVFQ